MCVRNNYDYEKISEAQSQIERTKHSHSCVDSEVCELLQYPLIASPFQPHTSPREAFIKNDGFEIIVAGLLLQDFLCSIILVRRMRSGISYVQYLQPVSARVSQQISLIKTKYLLFLGQKTTNKRHRY